jgi:carbonic anhydrase/acetyltransferase-like protein (isoleucine patch superfamily)
MKHVLKKIAFTISLLVTSPLILFYFAFGVFTSDRDSLLQTISQLLSMLPGLPGNYLRAAFYSIALESCSNDVVVSFGALLFQEQTCLEPGVYIGPQCNIGKCFIGRNTLLGSGVHVMSGKKQHLIDDIYVPIKNQGGEYIQVNIGEDCWIGNASLIMGNIGAHSIIGAGSVVTDDIPEYSIAVGNPAKVIKSRK